MNAALPVYRGELQCRMLGMAVEAYTPGGETCAPGQAGELVCRRPFPCQPVGFWPLPGYGSEEDVAAAQRRYQEAYFSEFEGVWCECHCQGSRLEEPYLLTAPHRPRGPYRRHAFAGRERRGRDHARAERRRPVSAPSYSPAFTLIIVTAL